jgi:hypothetical protein
MDHARTTLLTSLVSEEEVNIDKILDIIEDPEEYIFLKSQLANRIKREPNSAQLHELLGVLLLEMGISKEAKEVSNFH